MLDNLSLKKPFEKIKDVPKNNPFKPPHLKILKAVQEQKTLNEMTGFDPKYTKNKSWVSENSDESFCLSDLDKDKNQRLKIEKDNNNQNMEDTHPNFIPAVFSMLSKDEEFIASDE